MIHRVGGRTVTAVAVTPGVNFQVRTFPPALVRNWGTNPACRLRSYKQIPMSNVNQNRGRRLAALVQEDPNLEPDEKEFNITMPKDEETSHIFCEITGPMRRLLTHKGMTVTDVRVLRDDGTVEKTEPHLVTDGAVVAVWGEVPRGYVKVGSRCRNDSSPASIVSRDASATTHEEETSTVDGDDGEADIHHGQVDFNTEETGDAAESTQTDQHEDDGDNWMSGQINSGPPDDGDEGGMEVAESDDDEGEPESEQDEEDDDGGAKSVFEW